MGRFCAELDARGVQYVLKDAAKALLQAEAEGPLRSLPGLLTIMMGVFPLTVVKPRGPPRVRIHTQGLTALGDIDLARQPARTSGHWSVKGEMSVAITELFLYSPAQAASVLGISRSRLYELMGEGQLGSIHIGRSRKLSHAHLSDFISSLEESQ